MDKVMEGLFISDCFAARDKELLTKNKITHVVIAASMLEPVYPMELEYLQLPVEDFYTENISKYFRSSIEFINKARKNDGSVLVHCAAGVSRSSTIVLAYLMSVQNQGLHECMAHLRKCRPCIWPNEGFYKQLLGFEKELGLTSKVPKPAFDYLMNGFY